VAKKVQIKQKSVRRKRLAIIASYFAGESYGLLGPQVAATIIQDNTPYECVVIAVTRDDPKDLIKKNLDDYFGNQRPIIGFSSLSASMRKYYDVFKRSGSDPMLTQH